MSEPKLSPRAWQVVLDSIEHDLLTAALVPGDRLPPERDLATRLGVGRSSVREALRVLEVMGLIRTAVGSGPSAGAVIVATPDGGIASLLRLHLAAQGFPITDVVRTRVVLESAVVRDLADQGKTAESLADVHSLLRSMESADLSPSEFLVMDASMHLALAAASGNVVITAMMAGLRSAIEAYVHDTAARIPEWDVTVGRLCLEHRSIMEAVQSGDPDLAADLVRAHILGYYTEAMGEQLQRPPAPQKN